MQADQGGRDGGDLTDAVFQGPDLAVKNPVAKEVGAPVGAVVAGQVGAAVGGADHHARVDLGFADCLGPLRAFGPPAQPNGEVLIEGKVKHRVGGGDALLGGDVRD